MGELAGQPNFFVEKILNSLIQSGTLSKAGFVSIVDEFTKYYTPFRDELDKQAYLKMAFNRLPKLHTLRLDPNNRWKPGMKIHFVINNRTKKRFQFAPVMEVKNVQEVEIRSYETDYRTGANYTTFLDNYRYKVHKVSVDGRILGLREVSKLVLNDGFPSVEAFFRYFNEDVKLKLIQWTDLKY